MSRARSHFNQRTRVRLARARARDNPGKSQLGVFRCREPSVGKEKCRAARRGSSSSTQQCCHAARPAAGSDEEADTSPYSNYQQICQRHPGRVAVAQLCASAPEVEKTRANRQVLNRVALLGNLGLSQSSSTNSRDLRHELGRRTGLLPRLDNLHLQPDRPLRRLSCCLNLLAGEGEFGIGERYRERGSGETMPAAAL